MLAMHVVHAYLYVVHVHHVQGNVHHDGACNVKMGRLPMIGGYPWISTTTLCCVAINVLTPRGHILLHALENES